jgi:hypothetical protein
MQGHPAARAAARSDHGSGTTCAPGSGRTRAPGSCRTRAPGSCRTRAPGSGRTCAPGSGRTRTPGSGRPGTPGSRRTFRRIGRPANTHDKRDGKISRPFFISTFQLSANAAPRLVRFVPNIFKSHPAYAAAKEPAGTSHRGYNILPLDANECAVIPAKAGIQFFSCFLDARFHGHDTSGYAQK